ncbi:hypothetical protein A9Q81_11840 [Gammaproteobacteria bacterium 42_54_T18]|nr:hypothetical protein A9Q81_11840 [Gammaproteobacteria bacterium 42_54_T18]
MNDHIDESELEMARKRRKKSAKETLATHLDFLISKSTRGGPVATEGQIARKIGTSQRTLNNMRRCNLEDRPNPALSNIESVAHYFDMPVWQLLIPNLHPDFLESDELDTLVSNFIKAPTEQREGILSKLVSHPLEKTKASSRPKGEVPSKAPAKNDDLEEFIALFHKCSPKKQKMMLRVAKATV